jgi:hypothetical protein
MTIPRVRHLNQSNGDFFRECIQYFSLSGIMTEKLRCCTIEDFGGDLEKAVYFVDMAGSACRWGKFVDLDFD